MVNTTIGVKPGAFARLKRGRFAMMQKLGLELSYSDVLEHLMDTAGWPKEK